ncbi:MAG: ligand-gated channel [Planctomycetaceae bacterium]|nr:ligand-gated channel [Planctomycetaceae bacterium]
MRVSSQLIVVVATGCLLSSQVSAAEPLLKRFTKLSFVGRKTGEQDQTGRVIIPVIQETEEAESADDEAAGTSEGEIPTIPETEVTAEPFPRSPLSNDNVLTPTRTVKPRGRVGSSVTVITEEQIRQSQHTYVQDVLRTVPGLDIARSGGPGQITSVFLRGGKSEQTKVFLDGIPINDPSNAARSFDFGSLTLDNIERIEVLRGAQSTLYGSDAIGGVIYITTKRGDGPLTVRATSAGGTFDTFNQSASLSGGNDKFYYSVGGSFYETNGFSAISKNRGGQENDGFRNGTVSGRMGWIPTESIDVDYVFRYNDSDAQIDDSFTVSDDLIRKVLNESFFSRIQTRMTSWDGKLEQIAGYNYVNYNRADTNSGIFLAPEFEGRTVQFDYQANLLFWDSCRHENILTVGTHYLDEAASDSFSTQRRRRYNRSAFIQDQISIDDRLFLTIGGRSDFYSLAGSTETYQATGRYELSDERTAIHASIGTGFRAPSFSELQFGPNLRPEESKGWEYGVEYALNNGRFIFDATYFRNDFKDQIAFDFNTFTLQNIGSALASGVEVAGTLYVAEASYVTATYTHTDTRDRSDGQELVRRPRHKFNVRYNQRFLKNKANANFGYRWVDDRRDFGGILDDYSALDMALSYNVSDQLQLFARVDNVLDEIYEEVINFATPRVSAFAGATITFSGSKK